MIPQGTNVAPESAVSETQDFKYDALDRLTQAFGSYGQKEYRYDAVGNLTLMSGNRVMNFNYDGFTLTSGTGLEMRYDGLGNTTDKLMGGVLWQYQYDDLGRMAAVFKDGQLVQTMAYDFRGERVARVVFQGNASNRVYATFYPAEGMEVRVYEQTDRIVVTKVVSAGAAGRLASYDEEFSRADLNKAGQYGAYANLFDPTHPKGLALVVLYRGLAFLHRPPVERAVPLVLFGLAIFVLVSLLLSSLFNEVRDRRFKSGFNPFSRGLAFSMVVMLVWTAGCTNKNNNDVAPTADGGNGYIGTQPVNTTPTGNDQVPPPAEANPDYSTEEQVPAPAVPTITHKSFYHANQVQTATMVTDDQGKLSAKLRHLPYGEVHEPSSYGHERVQKKFASFTGQEMDNDTGLVYYHFRYYDPSLGRFLTPDNLIPGGGDDPQEYNRYAYVNGNPVKYTDPTGHWKCCKKLMGAVRTALNPVLTAANKVVEVANSVKDSVVNNNLLTHPAEVLNGFKDNTVSALKLIEIGITSAVEAISAGLITAGTMATGAINQGAASASNLWMSSREAASNVWLGSQVTFEAIKNQTLANGAAIKEFSAKTINLLTKASSYDDPARLGSQLYSNARELGAKFVENQNTANWQLARSPAFWDGLNTVATVAGVLLCAGCAGIVAGISGGVTGFGKSYYAEGKSMDESLTIGGKRGLRQYSAASVIDAGYTLYTKPEYLTSVRSLAIIGLLPSFMWNSLLTTGI